MATWCGPQASSTHLQGELPALPALSGSESAFYQTRPGRVRAPGLGAGSDAQTGCPEAQRLTAPQSPFPIQERGTESQQVTDWARHQASHPALCYFVSQLTYLQIGIKGSAQPASHSSGRSPVHWGLGTRLALSRLFPHTALCKFIRQELLLLYPYWYGVLININTI